MSAYYQLRSEELHDDGSVTRHYTSTLHAQGAWNEHEQHMAPATGLIAAELEAFQPRSDMRIARISLDIFGLIHAGDFSIHTHVLRPGRTIELLESTMTTNGKTSIVARAWRMQTSDTSAVAALEDGRQVFPENMPPWEGMSQWAGGFIRSIEARTNFRRNGKGVVWINNGIEMVEGKPTSDFVHLMGMVDTANGTAPRIQQTDIAWIFPNVDLQIHMHRAPHGQWLGLETVQQIGHDGIGLTSTVLHDVHGVFGRAEQILTVRKVK